MSVAQARSRVAVEVKKQKRTGGSSRSEAVQQAQRLLAEEKIRAFIERTIASAPPLSESCPPEWCATGPLPSGAASSRRAAIA